MATRHTLVTRTSHPMIFDTLEVVTCDSGASPKQEGYSIADKWKPQQLSRIEKALSMLSPEDRETMAIGERSDIEIINQRSSELKLTNKFLDEFFNGI